MAKIKTLFPGVLGQKTKQKTKQNKTKQKSQINARHYVQIKHFHNVALGLYWIYHIFWEINVAHKELRSLLSQVQDKINLNSDLKYMKQTYRHEPSRDVHTPLEDAPQYDGHNPIQE